MKIPTKKLITGRGTIAPILFSKIPPGVQILDRDKNSNKCRGTGRFSSRGVGAGTGHK